MTYERTQYLVNVNVAKLDRVGNYRVLDRLTRAKCPVCGKLKTGLNQHIQAAHPSFEIKA